MLTDFGREDAVVLQGLAQAPDDRLFLSVDGDVLTITTTGVFGTTTLLTVGGAYVVQDFLVQRDESNLTAVIKLI